MTAPVKIPRPNRDQELARTELSARLILPPQLCHTKSIAAYLKAHPDNRAAYIEWMRELRADAALYEKVHEQTKAAADAIQRALDAQRAVMA